MRRHIYWTKKVYLLKSIFFYRTDISEQFCLWQKTSKTKIKMLYFNDWMYCWVYEVSYTVLGNEDFFFFFNFDLVWSIAATNVFSSSFSVPNEHIITNVCLLLPIVVYIYLFSSLEFASSSVFLQWPCSQTVKPNVIMWRQFKGKKNWLFQLQGRSEIAANEL